MCGEQEAPAPSPYLRIGSPPRVRGTVSFEMAAAHVGGITPACAGNRLRTNFIRLPKRDHPRVCGEQQPEGAVPARGQGSPPRVRGTVDDLRLGGGKAGITPACAGNSWRQSCSWCCSKDHPRVCGEQRNLLRSFPFVRGSPPRVRGTVVQTTLYKIEQRITPACAGNS